MLKRTLAVLPTALTWLILAVQTAPAAAGETVSPWYAGIGAGISRLEPESSGTYKVDDKISSGYRLMLGYDWNDRIAIEGYFSDLGEAGISPQGNVGYRDVGMSGLYYLQKQNGAQGEGWRAFLKGGLGWMKNDSDLSYERVHNSHVMLGLGGGYAFANGVALRADLDLYDKDSQFLILSISKRFGAGSSEAGVGTAR